MPRVSRPRYQRRHYTDTAALLADQRTAALAAGDMFALDTVNTIRDRYADIFRADNPRFDPSRFLAACDGQTVTGKRKG